MRGDEDGAKGRVTAGDSLPYQNDIGLDVPVLNGERLSRPAHTAHDFVGNEQDAALAADFVDALGVAVGGGGCGEGHRGEWREYETCERWRRARVHEIRE